MFGGENVTHKAVGRKQECRVTPSEAVKGRLTLELDVAEHGVNGGNGPSELIGLDVNLDLRVLREVDALDVLKEVLAAEGQATARNVLAGEEHLGKSDELFVSPLADVLNLFLHLIAHALREVDILHADFGCVHLNFALAPGKQGTVGVALELGECGLGDDCLGERDTLLDGIEVVRHDAVHATLLQEHASGLRNEQVGVNLLLRFIERVAEQNEFRSGGNCRCGAILGIGG